MDHSVCRVAVRGVGAFPYVWNYVVGRVVLCRDIVAPDLYGVRHHGHADDVLFDTQNGTLYRVRNTLRIGTQDVGGVVW